MTKSAKRKLIVTGTLLLLGLPICVVAAGIYCYFAPRQYYAQATIEFSAPKPGGANARSANIFLPTDPIDPVQLKELRRAFTTATVTAGLSRHQSATLEPVPNTDLFTIGVYDSAPQGAADCANTLAESLHEKFAARTPPRTPSPGSSSEEAALNARIAAIETQLHISTLRIWERAVPSPHPARPNIPEVVVTFGIAPGLFLAILGGTLLFVVHLTKETRLPPNLPQAVA